MRRRGVVRVHLDHVLRVSNADVSIFDVVHETAAARVRLDAKPVVRAVDREVEHANGVRATIGLAADRDTVAAIEVVVRDRDIRAAAVLPALIATSSSPVLM